MNVLAENIQKLLNMSNEKEFENSEDFIALWNNVISDIANRPYPKPFQNDIWTVIGRMSQSNQNRYVINFRTKILDNKTT